MNIAVLVSGGVDSSVALRLLHDEGHDLTAFYLKVWLEEEVLSFAGDCPWEEDVGFVRQTCEELGVPLEIVPLQGDYYELVVEMVLAQLRAGRTPSPDIFCNRRIKFGAFLEGPGSDFERVASGHYARLLPGSQGVRLLRGVDSTKDQSYFLSHLTQEQVARVLFPVGGLPKSEVRELAARYALPSYDRKDSQGICFLGKIDYREFIAFHLGQREGPIVDIDSCETLGQHHGYWFYTIGQRYGLGLAGGPWYVVGKDIASNTVQVTHADHRREHSRDTFDIGDLNWICPPARHEEGEVLLKLRHGPNLAEARIESLGGDRLRVHLAQADPGVAPGQHAVIYNGEECLGGSIIC
ncbi:MAG: tRNA 2-thiouridine(34) synthase MnmA [Candidatus Latescibacterota bacterium]|nr:tRNA 2-thiouridine(34) synthase MnmA [Candidatus Latescibacterota bacterium]